LNEVVWVSILDLVDVVLVKADPIINQPALRDQKIIKSLSKRYSTMVLGWNRRGIEMPKEKVNSYGVTFKFLNLRAPSGAPSLLAYLPFFWTWVIVKLFWHKPKVVHACDLEAMPPCYIYKKIFREDRKLIFDVFDRHAMAYIPLKNAFFKKLYAFTNSVEERLAEGSDILISVSEELINTFQRKPKKCVPILNCAEDYHLDKLSNPEKYLKLAYTGHIRKHRGIEVLTAAIKDMARVNLVVTGRIEDEKLLNEIEKISNLTYLGFLEHSQVLEIQSNSDAMVALYDLNANTQNRYVVGNKLFEAMMCGVPIITNVATDIVNETQCGIIVDYDNLDQIKQTIIDLRDNPELRKKLGDNGRNAFLQKYNWNAMEEKLYKIYEQLL
jgi:glycosyltransferase involved in cell wall biosynthesis